MDILALCVELIVRMDIKSLHTLLQLRGIRKMERDYDNYKLRVFSLAGFSSICIIELILAIIYSRFRLSIIWNSVHGAAFIFALICFCVFVSTLSEFLRGILLIPTLLIWIFMMIVFSVGSYQSKKFYLSTPNGKTTLIAEERTGFGRDSCFFYVKKYGLFKERLDNYLIEVGTYRPFTTKSYNINWINDNEVDFSFNMQEDSSLRIIEKDIIYNYYLSQVREERTDDLNYVREYKAEVKDLIFKIRIGDTPEL